MFGLFKKKIKSKDIIISNIGFHKIFNYCRDNFDLRLHDDFSNAIHKKIIEKLYQALKNGATDDELYNIIINSFDMISPNGSPQSQFKEAAQKFTKSTNKLSSQKIEEIKTAMIESKFSMVNIEETIKLEKEQGTW